MPAGPGIPQLDLSRPECRDTHLRITELRAEQRRWHDRLQEATSHEQRKQILHTIESFDSSIGLLEEELYANGCYVVPGPPPPLVQVVGMELTQSTQYYSIDGTGAGPINSIPLIRGKPLLVRVYLENRLFDPQWVTGRLAVMAFNTTTLEYDILRRHVDPLRAVNMFASSRSPRRPLDWTLNFLVPGADCYGNLRFQATTWVPGHESDPVYRDVGAATGRFELRETPVIHCFRMSLSRAVPSTSTPTQIAAPSDADCRSTIGRAERMFPVARLDVRDRGTRRYPTTGSAPLQTFADYAAVRAAIQTVRDGTTPTPEPHEVYVAMLPAHPAMAPAPFGQGVNGSIVSLVDEQDLFAHELGHLLLPGDDHVAGCSIAGFAMTGIDTSYPNYPNATHPAGIGEPGVDVGASPPDVLGPETPDVMSYCAGRKWISPYNYQRAFAGAVLHGRAASDASADDAQKLLLAFRLHRDGSAELRWALHLPGEPRGHPAGARTGIVVELYDRDGALMASADCARAPDRPETAPYEDFQEVLPWFPELASVLVVRDGAEVARWPVEDATADAAVGDVTVTERTREDGESLVHVAWKTPDAAAALHHMVRFSPDDGRTWIPLAGEVRGTELDVEADLLRGIERCRFQVAASTGFRTTLAESTDTIAGPTLTRELTIVQPQSQERVLRGEPVWLEGAVSARFDGGEHPVTAFWTSNRDGFLGDGLGVLAGGLSAGRHVLRLAADDGSGGELCASVVVWVDEQRGEHAAV